MKVWVNRSELVRITSLGSYLFTIARNESFDSLRKQVTHGKFAARKRAGESLDDTYAFSLAYDLERIEGVVSQCVEGMPYQRQMVYKMSREDKLSSNEIAQKLQLSKRTVDRHISLALNDIRAALENIITGVAFFLLFHWV